MTKRVPVIVDGTTIATVTVSFSNVELALAEQHVRDALRGTVALGTLVAALAAIAEAVPMSRRIVAPLTRITDTARRLGLVPLVPPPDVLFDAKQHQLLDGQTAKEGSAIGDLIAPGYTFQGQLLRLPVVTVKESAPEKVEEPDPQLSFEDQASAPA